MIDYPTFCQIHHLHQQKGMKATQIAVELQLGPIIIQTWLDQPTFRPRQSPKRSSKLEAFNVTSWRCSNVTLTQLSKSSSNDRVHSTRVPRSSRGLKR
jgi:hypothetical protein